MNSTVVSTVSAVWQCMAQQAELLAQKLLEAEERIRELEEEIHTLRKYVTKQIWPRDQRIPADKWLTRTISELSEEKHEEIEFRRRAKTVIDISVIEELKIKKIDIQLKVWVLPVTGFLLALC
jgi:hypothetical protein